ncbi:MAG: hypothetical protein AB1921_18445 [Thermodesulfobacteriota bacterium]
MQQPLSWRLTPSTIAALVSREALAGHFLLGRTLAPMPGEVLAVFRAGRLLSLVTQGEGFRAGGLASRISGMFSAGEDIACMFLDSEAFSLSFRMGAQVKELLPDAAGIHTGSFSVDQPLMENGASESVPPASGGDAAPLPPARENGTAHGVISSIAGGMSRDLDSRRSILTSDGRAMLFGVRATLRVIPDKAERVFALLKGRSHLEREDLVPELRAELVGHFAGEVLAHPFARLSADLSILGRINTEARKRVENLVSEWGMALDRLAVNPSLSDLERKGELNREREALLDDAKRRHALALSRIRHEHAESKLREELADQMEKARRERDRARQELAAAALLEDRKADLAAAEVEVRIAEIRDAARLQALAKEKELSLYADRERWEQERRKMRESAEIEMDRMRVLAEEYRKNKREKARLLQQEMALRESTAEAERRHVEKLLAMGASAGTLTEGLLREALIQQTVRKAIAESEGLGQIFGDVEAKRHELDLFRDGQNSQPPIGIAGQGQWYIQTGGSSRNGAGRKLEGGSSNPLLPAAGSVRESETTYPDSQSDLPLSCPSCGGAMPAGSLFCGFCGRRLGKDRE